MKKKTIQDAIAAGEARYQAKLEAERLAAQQQAEAQRREDEKRAEGYRKAADAWVKLRLAAVVEEAASRGLRHLDVTEISRDLQCTDDILAAAVKDAGMKVETAHREDCDYETGRPLGTYTTTYKAVW